MCVCCNAACIYIGAAGARSLVRLRQMPSAKGAHKLPGRAGPTATTADSKLGKLGGSEEAGQPTWVGTQEPEGNNQWRHCM